MDFSRSRRCSRRKDGALRELRALRLRERIHRADALAAPREPVDALPERRLLGLVRRRREPRLVELLAHLVEAGGELRAPVLEPGERHLDHRAALAGRLELAPQLRLLVREPAQLAAFEAAALLVADVELRDEARGVRPQGAGPRLDGRAGGAHVGELGQTAVELLEPLAVGHGPAARGLATLRRALGRGAALLELDATARDQREGRRVGALRLAQGRLRVVGGGPELFDLEQRVRRRGVGGLLAGRGLGELGGHALHGAAVALQVLLEVAAPRAELAERTLGRLRGDACLPLGRRRRVRGLPRRGMPSRRPVRPTPLRAAHGPTRRRPSRRAARATRAVRAAAPPGLRSQDRSGRRPAGSTRLLW